MHVTAEVIKRKLQHRVFMMEHAAFVYLYVKLCSHTPLVRVKGTSVLIDNPSAVSFQPFPMHLCSPSVTPLFPLTALSIASLIQPCQVYKYNDKSGSEFEGGTFCGASLHLQRHRHNTGTVQNRVMYISPLFWDTAGRKAALNE